MKDGQAIKLLDDETLDSISGGRIKVIQKKWGYRFSLDPILLADFVDPSNAAMIADLGTGCAIIPLLLAFKAPSSRIVGVEVQQELAEIARRNVLLNDLEGRVEIVARDMRCLEGVLEKGSFDWVLANPPYRRLRSGRLCEEGQKAIARHEIKATLDDVLRVTYSLLRSKGRLALVYPAPRAATLIAGLQRLRLEPKRFRPVYPYSNTPAKMVLVECVKEGGEELEILPPLILYEDKGSFTDEVKSIYERLTP